MKRTLMATVAMTVLLAPAAQAAEPRLEARAILPADASFPAPFPGIVNTDPAPAPNATQPVGGFSALLDAGNGDFYAMPDNGFGSKANSRSFILRLYKVRPRFRTEYGGRGDVQIRDAITLSDPDNKVPFPIVNENTDERILTGGDFDIESVRQAPDGTFYFGEEFGPFIVHVDAKGKVLDAPVGIPRIAGNAPVRSPDNPYLFGRPNNLGGSSGFEAMALSRDGKTLYPILEGAVTGDDPLTRRVYEFDVKERRYTGRTWTYRMSIPTHVRLRRRRLRQGPADRHRARQRPGRDRAVEEGLRDRCAGPPPQPRQARDRRPDQRQGQGRHLAVRRPPRRLRAREPVQVPVLRPSKRFSLLHTMNSPSSMTRISGQPGATRICRITAISSSLQVPGIKG